MLRNRDKVENLLIVYTCELKKNKKNYILKRESAIHAKELELQWNKTDLPFVFLYCDSCKMYS